VRGTSFDDRVALRFAECGGQLVRLNAACTLLGDVGLLAIAEASDGLKMLDVCSCTTLTSAAAAEAAVRHGASLSILGLAGLSLTLELVHSLLSGCPRLKGLGVGSTGLPGAQLLHLLALECPGLTSLSAHGLSGVDDDGVKRLLLGCPQLDSLDLHGCEPLCAGLFTLVSPDSGPPSDSTCLPVSEFSRLAYRAEPFFDAEALRKERLVASGVPSPIPLARTARSIDATVQKPPVNVRCAEGSRLDENHPHQEWYECVNSVAMF